VVDRVALGQFFFISVFLFYPVSSILPVFNVHIRHLQPADS